MSEKLILASLISLLSNNLSNSEKVKTQLLREYNSWFLHSKEIIAYSVSFTPNMKLIMSMIKMAFRKMRNPKGVIIHSDQGWHYRHKSYKGFLKKKKAIQSMSRKGH